MGMNVSIGEDAARLLEKMVASGQYSWPKRSSSTPSPRWR